MELSIPASNINTQNVYFVDKKKNIIVDGDFIKILYSTESFEMNGLYILVEFSTFKYMANQNWIQITTNRNAMPLIPKRTITFDPHLEENMALIERLCQIERDIVDRYIACFCNTKIASYILKTQLLSGAIKYHSEDKDMDSRTSSPKNSNVNAISFTDNNYLNVSIPSFQREKCILKISGVWETATNVGITMKFILLQKEFINNASSF
jgi:hypothetical protein